MMIRRQRLVALIFFTLTIAGIDGVSASPVRHQEAGTSADAPVKTLSSRRATMTLGESWRFAPAQGDKAPAAAAAAWGAIQVPGSWMRDRDITARGTGPLWANYNGRKLAAGWYERTIAIPADWTERSIILDFHRVSTDATVYVNEKEVGKVKWPEGTVDITDAVTPGKAARLRVFVVAATDQKEVLVLMGQAPGQTYSVKAELASGGLIGPVEMHSMPRGARVESVGVLTSTRKKTLGLDVELSGVESAGTAEFVASVRDEEGREEKRFTQSVNLGTAASGANNRRHVQIEWPWPDPRLWDLGKPHRYTLRLAVKGAGINDEFAQTFGFREFWIEGRKIILNGTEFRMRPTLGVRDIDQALQDGFNISESWPEDFEQRGTEVSYVSALDNADAKGFPITGVLPHMGWMANKVDTPDEQAAYLAAARRVIRRYRNHPSLVMWGTSGNMIGGPLDPAYVGVRSKASDFQARKNAETAKKYPLANQMIAQMKALDPTRPIFIHNGGPAGDIYTINNYLNFIPLQEREEWLSHYAKNGDMPLWYVEFGTPVSLSLMRARNGFSNAVQSEIFLSEYSAIYLGSDAYKLEPEAYRRRSVELFEKDQTYKWSHNLRERDYAPAWLQLQDLFLRNTWRSWRAWGITGGMIPWDGGYARLDSKVTPAGLALHAGNSPTLAWIAGAPEFTTKDHHFKPGQTVRKQVVLVNDSRAAQPYTVSWRAILRGKQFAQGTGSGQVSVARNLFLPFSFPLPAISGIQSDSKAAGEIILTATVGSQKHTDTFRFTVFPPLPARRGTVVAFDPGGKTTAMLTALGYTVKPWNGKSAAPLLVIGREALSAPGGKLPGSLETFVKRGGRAIVFEHNSHWMRQQLGLRLSHLQSRRVFRVGTSPATANLSGDDLWDWNGVSTLLNPYPDYQNDGSSPDTTLAKTNQPYAGWRWGNSGTVASAAIEKPHRSGWRPLLECEFDLAYSPLMELDFGAGRLVWCQLDLEDHASVDPAARKLATQVMEYARTAPLAPRKATLYLGDDTGKARLDALGLVYRRSQVITPDAGLVIVGTGAPVSASAVEAFAKRGGRVLVLPRAQADGGWGVQLARGKGIGSLEVPAWSEARGLSASDLRWRNEAEAWLIQSGAEIGAGGQIGRKVTGKGVLVYCQIDPDRFEADTKTYFRLTRWRQTRALCQLLANLGGTFQMDRRIFHPKTSEQEPQVTLAGPWQARLTLRRPAAVSTEAANSDPGISEEARSLTAGGATDWQTVTVPGDMENYGGAWTAADGEAVFRKVIDVPSALQGKALTLSLGTLDDYDETYFNGVRVGGFGAADKDPWGVQRLYTVPANLIKPGKNIITIRVWDRYGGGGFTGKPLDLLLKAAGKVLKPAGFYHPDYREDFDLGDEPYRYYNW